MTQLLIIHQETMKQVKDVIEDDTSQHEDKMHDAIEQELTNHARSLISLQPMSRNIKYHRS
jgi:hypothetical protein